MDDRSGDAGPSERDDLQVLIEHFSLAGRVSLALAAPDAAARRYVHAQMDPFAAAPQNGSGPADVVLEALDPARAPRTGELQKPARDGTVTLAADGRLFVLSAGRACAIPDPAASGPAVFACEPGFPLSVVWGSAVRPALHLKLTARGGVAVHSAAVERGDGAILVAGWSESGKTETALALMESGARFLSDKWTVLAPGGASAFPIGVGVRRWVLAYLPRLRGTLPRAARARLVVAGGLARATGPLRRGEGRAAEIFERGVALADRAALTPSEVRAAYGQSDDPARVVALRALVVLVTSVDGTLRAERADAAWAAARLARTAGYERRELFALRQRAAYSLDGPEDGGHGAAVAADERLLRELLDGATVLRVEAPFPVDPRRVAAAIEAAL